MLIGYKMLGNEALLPMNFFLQQWIPVSLKPKKTLELQHSSENKNTERSTLYWTGVFKQWAVTKGKMRKLTATKCHS